MTVELRVWLSRNLPDILRINMKSWLWATITLFLLMTHMVVLLPLIFVNITYKDIDVPSVSGWVFIVCLCIIGLASLMWTQCIRYEVYCTRKSFMDDRDAKKDWSFFFILHLMPYAVIHESLKYSEVREKMLYHHDDCCMAVGFIISSTLIVTIFDYILGMNMIFGIVTAYVIFVLFFMFTSGAFFVCRLICLEPETEGKEEEYRQRKTPGGDAESEIV